MGLIAVPLGDAAASPREDRDTTALALLALRASPVEPWTPARRAVADAAVVESALLGPNDMPTRVRWLGESRPDQELVAVEGEDVPRWIGSARLAPRPKHKPASPPPPPPAERPEVIAARRAGGRAFAAARAAGASFRQALAAGDRARRAMPR